MSARSVATLPPGMALGEYQLEAVLGTGGFGVTYRATDTYLGMRVALKEFYPCELVTRDAPGAVQPRGGCEQIYQKGLEQFLGEAQVMARFRHPNIVRVLRFFTANETGYIVMDFEEGESLAHHLRRIATPLTEQQILEIMLPIMRGLLEVHEKGILHLDIKPANIFLRRNGMPVLLDFGAARLGAAAVTDQDIVSLTSGYAPPEQYEGASRLSPVVDVYALGATLYRCFTGRPPVDALKRRIAIGAGQDDPLPPLARVAPERCSPGMSQAIKKMLALEPAERPGTMAEVFELLEVVDQEREPNSGPGRSRAASRRRHPAENLKVIIAGPVGAGKTTAVATLSDIEPVRTDAAATDMTKNLKLQTTVAFDYGVVRLDGGERVHLYGTPGQERFDFMWDILRKGAAGVVLLIDNSRREPFRDLDFFIDAFGDLIASTQLAIGITRMDIKAMPTIDDYAQHLMGENRGWTSLPPLFAVDARNRNDLTVLVRALLLCMDPGVENYRV
ncbi:MAG: protein kinase [Gammaproteobacteria bacterium]|nr:protein kinase [Gammaproteobacteria bacterium]